MDAAHDDHRFRCPGCDEEVDVSAGSVGQLVRCPYCNTTFFAADGLAAESVVDDTPPHDRGDDAPPADELDGLRIRQLSALRRGTMRVRSWWLIAMLLALITAGDFIGKIVLFVARTHGWGPRPTIFAAVAAVAGGFAAVAAGQVRRFGREAAGPALPPPAHDPDFATLSDGSDQWRHLEQIR